MWNMIAHSLSRLLQGFRLSLSASIRGLLQCQATNKANTAHPVAISRTTHPIDQISGDPNLPLFSLLMTSGAIYIGVPANDIRLPG